MLSMDYFKFESELDNINDDFRKTLEDPFMIRPFLENIRRVWRNYWDYKNAFERDVMALMEMDSHWKDMSVSFNTEYTVYGDDAETVILRMRNALVSPSIEKLNEELSLATNLASGAPPEIKAKIELILIAAIQTLIKDIIQMSHNIMFKSHQAADDAAKLLDKYGGFTFRYNVNFQNFSIDISKPPFAGLPSSINPPAYNSQDRTTTHASVIPPYNPLPYTIYIVKHGDSFWKIASEQMGNGARYEELARYNGLTSSHVIHAGDSLKIPR